MRNDVYLIPRLGDFALDNLGFKVVLTSENLTHQKYLDLQSALGYKFQNSHLLIQSLTHKSFAFETGHGGDPNNYNERLEFLGDAVLDLVVSRVLMNDPLASEGDLSKRRAALVNTKYLANVARKLNLSEYVILGNGEIKGQGATKDSILASTLEAIWGALFLDAGFEKALSVIENFFDFTKQEVNYFDYKSQLQEKWQAEKKLAPVYKLDSSEGPDHEKTFFVSVYINEEKLASGQGRSRKEAEQCAARNALEGVKDV